MDSWNYVLKFELREFMAFLLERKRVRNSRFSQRAFAAYVGLSPSTLNEILNGKRQVTKVSLEKIRQAVERDRDFMGYFKDYQAQRSLNPGEQQGSEAIHKAFQRLIEASEIAKKKQDPSQPLFCTLVVAVNQEDFGLLRSKVLEALHQECLFQDIFEVSFNSV